MEVTLGTAIVRARCGSHIMANALPPPPPYRRRLLYPTLCYIPYSVLLSHRWETCKCGLFLPAISAGVAC
jgi:hypothetical protein